MIRRAAGSAAVSLLKILGALPLSLTLAAGTALLPLYRPFHRRTRARLRLLSGWDPRAEPPAYYRLRLRLALLSLKHLLGRPDGCTMHIEGREHYRAALASGKPVVALGWHQGPVECLHRIPHEDPEAGGRPAFLLTARAFSPALTALMREGRAGRGAKEILHPGSMAGLKRWEKEKGVLAFMVDQVPGEPEAWLELFGGNVQVPYPARLLAWVAERDAEMLTVSVRWERGNRIVFRYEPVNAGNVKAELAERMEARIAAAPEAYNWSYPKVRVD